MLGAFLVVAQDLVSKESVGTPINEFVFGPVSSTPFSFFHVFLAMQHTCPGAVHWWFGKFLLCCVCCKCMSRARLAWKVKRKASNRRIDNPEGCLCVWSLFFSPDSKAFLWVLLNRPSRRVARGARAAWRGREEKKFCFYTLGCFTTETWHYRARRKLVSRRCSVCCAETTST